MIIDKMYDESLWLIKESDKRIGREIASLFNECPYEFLIAIRKSLKKYYECKNNLNLVNDLDWCNNNFSGMYMCDNGLLYRYKIEVLGTIEITKSFLEDGVITSLGCIILYPFNKDKIATMKSDDKQTLGMIGSSFSIIDDLLYVPISVATDVEYRKTFFGGIIDYWGYITNYKHIIHRAKINDIPKDFSLEEIQKIENNKKILRKKKI